MHACRYRSFPRDPVSKSLPATSVAKNSSTSFCRVLYISGCVAKL